MYFANIYVRILSCDLSHNQTIEEK